MTPEEQERIMDQEDRRLKEELFARLDEDYFTTYGPERIGLKDENWVLPSSDCFSRFID